MQKNVTKQQILNELLKVVQMTRAGEDIQSLDLDNKECFVSIQYKNGGKKNVCIEGDSGIAMVRDVCSVIN